MPLDLQSIKDYLGSTPVVGGLAAGAGIGGLSELLSNKKKKNYLASILGGGLAGGGAGAAYKGLEHLTKGYTERQVDPSQLPDFAKDHPVAASISGAAGDSPKLMGTAAGAAAGAKSHFDTSRLQKTIAEGVKGDDPAKYIGEVSKRFPGSKNPQFKTFLENFVTTPQNARFKNPEDLQALLMESAGQKPTDIPNEVVNLANKVVKNTRGGREAVLPLRQFARHTLRPAGLAAGGVWGLSHLYDSLVRPLTERAIAGGDYSKYLEAEKLRRLSGQND